MSLDELLSKKSIITIEGVDFLLSNKVVVGYIEDLKILPLKQSHIELLNKHLIPVENG